MNNNIINIYIMNNTINICIINNNIINIDIINNTIINIYIINNNIINIDIINNNIINIYIIISNTNINTINNDILEKPQTRCEGATRYPAQVEQMESTLLSCVDFSRGRAKGDTRREFHNPIRV
ncbi:unnamed protein product [Lampetra planeri]